MVCRNPEAVALVLPVQAQLGIAAFFGLQAGLAVFREALIQGRHAECRAHGCRYAPVLRKGKAVGCAARGFAAKFAVAVMAHIQLQGMRAAAVAVAQRHGVLVAVLLALRNRCVGQLVLAALQRSGKGVAALFPFVLQQVVAQFGFRAVGGRFRFVPLPRVIN